MFERAVKADLILDEEGLIVKDQTLSADGKEVIVLRIRKHPAVEISSRSWLNVKAFCSEFGLSPVSRLRLHPENDGDGDGDKMDDLMAALSQPREKKPGPGSPLIQ